MFFWVWVAAVGGMWRFAVGGPGADVRVEEARDALGRAAVFLLVMNLFIVAMGLMSGVQ